MHYRIKKSEEQGFAAIVSVVIISVLLIALTFTLSTTGFFVRFNVLDQEFKAKSLALAEGCANRALVKLAVDSAYSGNEDFKIGDDVCHIGQISNNGNYIFKTQGIAQKAYSNISVMAKPSDLSIISFSETPN